MHQSPEQTEREFPGVKSARRNVFFAPRAARVIAFSGAVALVAACTDSTAPPPPPPVEPPVPPALVSVAASLDDMTQWWMPSLQDATVRTNLQEILAGLKGHLNGGKVTLCQQDVTSARGVLSSVSDVEQVETGPIGVALDVVQATLDGVSK
jgi:hypothetical protein